MCLELRTEYLSYLRNNAPEVVDAARPIVMEIMRRLPRARPSYFRNGKAFEIGFVADTLNDDDEQFQLQIASNFGVAFTDGRSKTLAADLAEQFDRLGEMCDKAAAVCREVAARPKSRRAMPVKG